MKNKPSPKNLLLIFPALVVLAIFGTVFGWFESSPEKRKYVKPKLGKLIFNPSSIDSAVIDRTVRIHSFLKDTLKDQEEAVVLKIIEQSKEDNTLNDLIYALDENNILFTLYERFDEELLMYEDPSITDRLLAYITGESLAEKPDNTSFKNDLFELCICYDRLDEKAARKTLSCHANKGRCFEGPSDSSTHLQLWMQIPIFSCGVDNLSEGTLTISREVYTNRYPCLATHAESFQIAREYLGIE